MKRADGVGPHQRIWIDAASPFLCKNGACEEERTRREETSKLHALLSAQGFDVVKEEGDGNCQYRGLARQILGDPNRHDEIRQGLCDHMGKHPNFVGALVDGEVEVHATALEYIDSQRRNFAFGGELELASVVGLYRRPVWVFSLSVDGLTLEMNEYGADAELASQAPVMFCFRRRHYDSVQLTCTGVANADTSPSSVVRLRLPPPYVMRLPTVLSEIQFSISFLVVRSSHPSPPTHRPQSHRAHPRSALSLTRVPRLRP